MKTKLVFSCFTKTCTDAREQMVLPELLKAICDGIIDIVTCFTVAINDSLSVEMDKQKVTLIKSNAKFIAMALLPLVESKLKVGVAV